jgi:hypothetical protein
MLLVPLALKKIRETDIIADIQQKNRTESTTYMVDISTDTRSTIITLPLQKIDLSFAILSQML